MCGLGLIIVSKCCVGGVSLLAGLALLADISQAWPLQVNLDFESEADMVEKMRIGIALQPVATALFANSPFRDGSDTGEWLCQAPV